MVVLTGIVAAVATHYLSGAWWLAGFCTLIAVGTVVTYSAPVNPLAALVYPIVIAWFALLWNRAAVITSGREPGGRTSLAQGKTPLYPLEDSAET